MNMFHEPAAPKIISVLIFWSFFVLIMGFSLIATLSDKYRWSLRYARVCSRSCKRR